MYNAVNEVCDLLESYNGRDKVVRLACYVLKLWGSVAKDDGLLKASSRLSTTRMTLRLFDDLPTIKHMFQYGFGGHEADVTSSILGVLSNCVDQLFLPVEKVCWMADVGMLKLKPQNSHKVETLSTSLWAISLYLALLKCIKQIRKLSVESAIIGHSINKSEDLQRRVNIKQNIELVTGIKLCIDVVHAVNCLPEGWLWGGRLDGVQVGAIATISSLIGIGLHFSKKRLI